MKVKSNSWMAKLIRAMALAVLSGMYSNAAEIKVLFIGGDSASEIPADLMGLVSGDNSIADTITAEFYYEHDVLDAYYEDRALPSDTNTFLNKLDEGFDFVFVMPKESYLFRTPELALEEARLVQKHLQGTGTGIAIPMIWGSVYGAVDAVEYEDHSYRIGDALDIDILPAGLAWVNVLDGAPTVGASDPSSSLTSEASYLMAASAYVYIFEHSATNSTYTPSGVTTDERVAILSYSYSDWVGAATNSHYTGAYTGGFCSPLQIPFQVTNTMFISMGTSTEDGYGSKYVSIMSDNGYDAGRESVSAYDYNKYFPEILVEPDITTLLANNHYDFAFARFRAQTTSDYENLRSLSTNTDIPFIGFNYQGIGDNNEERILDSLASLSVDANYSAYHCYSQNQLYPGTVFNVPARIALSRLWDRSADLVEFSGVHVSDYVDAAVASMIYTMLTGENCTSFGHPGSMGQEQEQYEYAQNLGYTIIKQLGSLANVAYDEANTPPAAVVGSDASTHSTHDIYGGGVFYFVDSDENGSEVCVLHGTNSYDYEGSVTGTIWSDQGTNVSTATTFTNLVNTGSASVFGLAAIDDCSQTSVVAEATIRVLDPSILLHDDQDVAISGGYGWSDAAWTINYPDYGIWSTEGPYNGSLCLNVQRTGQMSRHLDLSSITNDVVFEYQWKGVSLEAGETATIDVYDGSWHTLKTVDSSMADGAWHAESVVLSAYNLTSPIEIRCTIAGDDNRDDLYIDAMRIYETDLPLSPLQGISLLDDPSFTANPDVSMPTSGSETFEYSALDQLVRFDTSNASCLAGQTSSFTAPINIFDDTEIISDPDYDISTTRLTGITPGFMAGIDVGIVHIGTLQLNGGTQQFDSWYVITLDTTNGIYTATSGLGALFSDDNATMTAELVDAWNTLSWDTDPFAQGGIIYEDINSIDIEWFHDTVVANTIDDSAVFRMDYASIGYESLVVAPDAIAPVAPTAVGATVYSSAVGLDWPDAPESDVISYQVYRSETAGSGYVALAEVFTSDFVDSTVVNGTPYYYAISTVDYSNNESPVSTEVSATPNAVNLINVESLLDNPSFTTTPDATLPTSGNETFHYSALGKNIKMVTSTSTSLAGQSSSFTAPINIFDDAVVTGRPDYDAATTKLTAITPNFSVGAEVGLLHVGVLQLAGGTQQFDAWYVITLNTVGGTYTATSGMGNIFGPDNGTMSADLANAWNTPLSWDVDPFATEGVAYDQINSIEIEWFHETTTPNTIDDSATFRLDVATLSYTASVGEDIPAAPVANADAYAVDMNVTFSNAVPGVLANDTDANGDALTASLVSTTTNGTLVLATDGSFTYQPDLDVTGIDNFTYEAIDATGSTSSVATVTLTITEPPNTSSGAITFGGVEGWLTQGFHDAVSTVETATITTNGITFALTATGSGSINTTTGAGDLFGITGGFRNYFMDNTEGASTEWVEFTLSVSGANSGDITDLSLDNLVLTDYIGTEALDASDGTTTQGILASVEGSSLDYTKLDTLNALSLANASGIGDDSWALRLAAPAGGASTAVRFSSLTVAYAYTVEIPAEAPVANADAYAVGMNVTFSNAVPGVLANDTDANGDALTASLVSTTTNGTLVLATDGSFTYQPDLDVTGIDTFTYEAIDAMGFTSSVATVTLTISEPPKTSSGAITFGGAEGWLTQGFNDAVSTVETATIETNGLTFALTATGSDTINTTAGVGDLFGITGGFQSYFMDNNGGASTEWVEFTLSVSGTNSGNITELSLDNLVLTDYIGTEVLDASDGTTTQGILASVEGSSLDYTKLDTLNALSLANASGIGDDSWALRLAAPAGGVSTAVRLSSLTVAYTVVIPPEAPVANADLYTVDVDSTFTNAAPGILANDTDGNDDPLTAIQLTSPTHGTLLSFSADGAFIYQPNAAFSGTDSFTYKANDGALDSGTSTVTLVVQVNISPVAPTGLSASLGNGTVILDWADNVEMDLASYNIYRSTVSGSYGSPITNIASSAFTDSSVTSNTTYYYVVTALDNTALESTESLEVSAAPLFYTIEELIVNGDFSDGTVYSDLTPYFETDYWKRTVGKTAPWLTSSEFDPVGSGNQALVYKTGTSTRGTVTQDISVEEGTVYTCSLRCKTYKLIEERPAEIHMSWYSSNGSLIQTDNAISAQPTLDWLSFTNQITAPANAAYATVDVGIGGLWSLTKLFIDDISVVGVRGQYNLPATFPKYPNAFTLPLSFRDQEPIQISLNDFIENKETNDVVSYAKLDGPAWLSVSPSGDLQGVVSDPNDVGTFTSTLEVYDGSSTITQEVVVVVTSQLRLNNIFNHNMVLQHGEPILFRGYSYTNAPIQIQVGSGPLVDAQSDSNGVWEATYPALSASVVPTEINLFANGFQVAYTNILIGDLWMCSGQSNMEYTTAGLLKNVISAEEFAALMAPATNQPTLRFITTPRTEDDVPWDDLETRADWQLCTTNTAADFSSVAYFFGKNLLDQNIPIGLIHSSKGGSPIETWSNRLGGGINRYNTKIHPFTKMPIKGVIWYQGEANVGSSARDYKRDLATLIYDWREEWQLSLPFYIVQIAPHPYTESGYTLPEFWEQQDQASREVENCGLVVTHDTVEILEDGTYSTDIHPPFKEKVGERLALWAKHDVYGQTSLLHSGPVPQAVIREGSQLRIHFDHVTANGLISSDGESLKAFEIANKDHLYVPATTVTIDGETLLVSATSITNPASVRFGWNEMVVVNFMNAEGLPASPFRMDVDAPAPFRRELLQNTTFDPGPTNTHADFDVPFWERTLTYTAVNSWVTDSVADPLIGVGNYAAEFIRVNNSIRQSFDAVQGRKYDFSVETMLTETGTVAYLSALWRYDDGTAEAASATIEQTDGFLNAPPSGEWFTLSGSLEAPNTTISNRVLVSGEIILTVGLYGEDAPSIYFDNASVKEHLLDVSYTNWQHDLDQTYAPFEDDDNDGLNNIEEYAFNLDPAVPDAVILTKETGTAGSPNLAYIHGDPSWLESEFIRRKDSTDLLYTVDVSTNLVDWEQTTLQATVEEIDSNWERVTVQDLSGSTNDSARFMRFNLQYQ